MIEPRTIATRSANPTIGEYLAISLYGLLLAVLGFLMI